LDSGMNDLVSAFPSLCTDPEYLHVCIDIRISSASVVIVVDCLGCLAGLWLRGNTDVHVSV